MRRLIFVCGMAVVSCTLAHADLVQVGDLRIGASDFSSQTYFDPGFGSLHGAAALTTRSVVGAPVLINSDFSGTTSDDNGDATPSSSNDIGLRTFSSVTQIRTLNRFVQDTTIGTGTDQVGAVQWTINLSPLDSYLSTNNLALTALNLDVVLGASDDSKKYDLYLSYANPAESITLASISTSASTNHDDLWIPAQSSAEGGIVAGTHKIIELQNTGDLTLSESLLSLYGAGVKDFSLVLTSGDFLSGRVLQLEAGSGISIDTVAVPEPSPLVMILLCCFVGAIRKGCR